MKWLLHTIFTWAEVFDAKFLSLVNPNIPSFSELIAEAQWAALMNCSGNSPGSIDSIWPTEQK